MTIVLLEDNANIREALSRYLELEGWQVVAFGTIAPLESWLERQGASVQLDLAILDVMLPDGDGFLLARRLRSKYSFPFLFLTAKTEESDRITGLELGAEDYVVKPFSNREVILRVKAILRRQPQVPGKQGCTWRLGSEHLEIKQDAHLLRLDGRVLDLTAAEWHILAYLIQHAPQVCSRAAILAACLDSFAENSERTVDTHIKNIRHKLGQGTWIETVRAFGYRFVGQEDKP